MVTQTGAQVRDHWLLKGLAPEDVEDLLRSGHEMCFEPGQVVFNDGDPSDGLYLIVAGVVRITGTGTDGETLIALARPDELLGELGVLDALPRSARAASVGMCVGYFLPAENLLDLLERSAPLCMRLMALLTKRLRYANGRLGELSGTAVLPSEAMDPVA